MWSFVEVLRCVVDCVERYYHAKLLAQSGVDAAEARPVCVISCSFN